MYRNFDVPIINRSTYSLLQFLGDVGGLDTVLKLIGLILVSSFRQFLANSIVVTQLYF